MECINVLVCEHDFIFCDDRHWLLALLATGSVMPVVFTLTAGGSERVVVVAVVVDGGGSLVWLSSLINDWFVFLGDYFILLANWIACRY